MHQFLGPTGKSLGFAPKPQGYWQTANRKNIRLFLENFAKKRNMDPLIAENWYSISTSEFTLEVIEKNINTSFFKKYIIILFNM